MLWVPMDILYLHDYFPGRTVWFVPPWVSFPLMARSSKASQLEFRCSAEIRFKDVPEQIMEHLFLPIKTVSDEKKTGCII